MHVCFVLDHASIIMTSNLGIAVPSYVLRHNSTFFTLYCYMTNCWLVKECSCYICHNLMTHNEWLWRSDCWNDEWFAFDFVHLAFDIMNMPVYTVQLSGDWIQNDYYYYNHFTAHWTVFGTTTVSRYQKGRTRKAKPIWIYWSKR